MKFIVQGQTGFLGAVPNVLRPVARIPESSALKQRTLMLRKMLDPCAGEIWMINDLPWQTVTEYPRLGTTEIWAFENRSGVSHPMHLHLVSFQILDRQDFMVVGNTVVTTGPRVEPPPSELGWKDTVRADPNQITRVIARFDGWPGRYSYHCHVLEHEDHEMMRQFQAVCTGDYNANGVISVQDIFDYLSAWNASAGRCSGQQFFIEATDLNGDQCTRVQDLYDFLAAWTNPCPIGLPPLP
jgi:hypothetical protein